MKRLNIDLNSTENQEIKSKFINQHVLTCFSYEMQDCIEKEAVSYDEIENAYIDCCPHCESEEVYQVENSDSFECKDCEQVSDSLDSKPQEIFEWWIVTEYLYSKLKEQGEAVLAWGNNYYWGRCTTGQAILLDGVISRICSDMEIMQGQKYSWEA